MQGHTSQLIHQSTDSAVRPVCSKRSGESGPPWFRPVIRNLEGKWDQSVTLSHPPSCSVLHAGTPSHEEVGLGTSRGLTVWDARSVTRQEAWLQPAHRAITTSLTLQLRGRLRSEAQAKQSLQGRQTPRHPGRFVRNSTRLLQGVASMTEMYMRFGRRALFGSRGHRGSEGAALK